tara:strand:- start:807 stop:1115 length:309 start_codon:yes stop_codon:yes gene_type:complete
MSSGTCFSSGVRTADAIITKGRCKLISIHASTVTSGTFTVKVYDSADNDPSSAGEVEVARMQIHALDANKGQSLEYDMHGVVCQNGIFVDITGTGAYSIEYA